jgi:hypothetical protein
MSPASIVYFLCMISTGCALLSLILGSAMRHWSLLVIWTLAVGFGGLPTLLMWLSMLGVAPRRATIILTGAVSFVIVLARRRSLPRPEFLRDPIERIDIISAISAVALLVLVAGVARITLPYRVPEPDAWAIWSLKAKVVTLQALNPRPAYFTTLPFSYSHLDYPLLLPFLTAGHFAVHGAMDDRASQSTHFILYLGSILSAYAISRAFLRRPAAMLLATTAAAIPSIITWAASGDADIPLMFFYLAALITLIQSPRDENWRTDLLCAAFCAFAMMTKHEGKLISLLIFGAAIALRGVRKIRTSIRIPLLALTIYLPWLLWSLALPQTHENYPARFRWSVFAANSDRIKLAAYELLKSLFSLHAWGPLWYLLIVAALLGARAFAFRLTQVLWIILLAHVAGYIFIYVITPWNLQEILAFTVSRLTLHLLPPAVALVAIHLGEFAQPLRTNSG